MKTLKERLVNKKLIYISILSIIIFSSCINRVNEDIALLEIYFNDLKFENKKDSIFFGLNNYNVEIIKTYERYLRTKKDLQEFDFPINEIFLKSEYDNFKNQVVDSSSTWNIDLNVFENVYPKTTYPHKNNFTYVSKPIYTIDEKYALIYGYIKGNEDVYFINSIYVYTKNDKSWIRISKIKHIQ